MSQLAFYCRCGDSTLDNLHCKCSFVIKSPPLMTCGYLAGGASIKLSAHHSDADLAGNWWNNEARASLLRSGVASSTARTRMATAAASASHGLLWRWASSRARRMTQIALNFSVCSGLIAESIRQKKLSDTRENPSTNFLATRAKFTTAATKPATLAALPGATR